MEDSDSLDSYRATYCECHHCYCCFNLVVSQWVCSVMCNLYNACDTFAPVNARRTISQSLKLDERHYLQQWSEAWVVEWRKASTRVSDYSMNAILTFFLLWEKPIWNHKSSWLLLKSIICTLLFIIWSLFYYYMLRSILLCGNLFFDVQIKNVTEVNMQRKLSKYIELISGVYLSIDRLVWKRSSSIKSITFNVPQTAASPASVVRQLHTQLQNWTNGQRLGI